jgi:hypothetical protein
MNIGDKVVTINAIGEIVGVSSSGLPIVEWTTDDFMSYEPEQLIVVDMPKPTEELDPSKDPE